MSLLRRVERLEARLGPVGCALCSSPERVGRVLADSGEVSTTNPVCPSCGMALKLDAVLTAMAMRLGVYRPE